MNTNPQNLFEASCQLAFKRWKETPCISCKDAATASVRETLGLSGDDGIWGGSEAATALGFAGHPASENLLDRVVKQIEDRLHTELAAIQ